MLQVSHSQLSDYILKLPHLLFPCNSISIVCINKNNCVSLFIYKSQTSGITKIFKTQDCLHCYICMYITCWHAHFRNIHVLSGYTLSSTHRLSFILHNIYFCLVKCCRNLSISTVISAQTRAFIFIYTWLHTYICTYIFIYICICTSMYINLSC